MPLGRQKRKLRILVLLGGGSCPSTSAGTARGPSVELLCNGGGWCSFLRAEMGECPVPGGMGTGLPHWEELGWERGLGLVPELGKRPGSPFPEEVRGAGGAQRCPALCV